jgi:hypothetical protein
MRFRPPNLKRKVGAVRHIAGLRPAFRSGDGILYLRPA